MASTTANANIINTSITSTAVQSSSSTIHSPGRRGGGSRVMPSSSSPWSTIVRGESDAIAAATATALATNTPSSPLLLSAPSPTAAAMEPVDLVASPPLPLTLNASSSSPSMMADDESCDNGNGSSSNGNAGKRPAWNKPSNGVVEVGPVMGAVSWPALSESAGRSSGKPSLDSSSKGLSDGSSSISVPQGTGSTPSSSSQKQVTHNANPNLTPNHTMPARQRSFKRNAGNSTSNGGVSQPTGSHPQAGGDVHSNNSSPRDNAQRNSQSRNANDHPQQQRNNSFRRNGGPHSRDASHHHNYGRRDQDRTNQDWNAHRNFNGRDAHMQPQRVVPRFMRHPPPPPPPPSTAPFIGPPPVRAFGNPIGFHELAPPMYYVAGPPADPLRAVPFVAPIPHAMYFPAPDIQLHSKIVNQIDYYFSNENLIKDTFLRQNMDEQGFVPVKLIAGFNKVSHLTDNIQLILDAVRSSTIVEVQGDKVRRRNDWMRWMMPSVQLPNVPGSPSIVRPSHDMLVASVQSISLEENANLQSGARSQADVHNEAFLCRASSGDLNNQSQVSSAEGAGQVFGQGVSDSSTSARNSSK